MGIFDQIKSAFGRDVPQPAKKRAPPPPGAEPGPVAEPLPADAGAKPYVVKSGDTLWKIAEETLGDGERYPEIFAANRDLLDSPDHVLPGQELKIP